MSNPIRITRLVVKNYRGIEERDESFGPGGAVIKGRNGAGKTTFLNAFRAALSAKDIGPDAIRQGADRAEILVDMGDYAVKRVITAKTSTVTVRNGAGDIKSSPQKFLQELVGSSALDPLDLFLAKPKERRAAILAALPIRVTEEQLAEWLPDVDFPAIGMDLDTSHGLEVVAALHRAFYDRRTAANADAKAVKMSLDTVDAEAKRAAVPVPPGEHPELEVADRDLAACRARVESLAARAREAAASEARTAETRRRIVESREGAIQARAEASRLAPDHAAVAANQNAIVEAENELHRLRGRIAEVEQERARLVDARRAFGSQADRATQAGREAEAFDREATALESAIATMAAPAPTAEEIAAAQQAAEAAGKVVFAATLKRDADTAKRRADGLRGAADAAAAKAKALDGIVQKLANDVPAELLAASDGIPGLGLDGDDITLDGVSITALSQAEQMKFAVEVARRANRASKMLFVDGLERLDPEQHERFIRSATAGGWWLLGTCVRAGELVVEAISQAETDVTGLAVAEAGAA